MRYLIADKDGNNLVEYDHTATVEAVAKAHADVLGEAVFLTDYVESIRRTINPHKEPKRLRVGVFVRVHPDDKMAIQHMARELNHNREVSGQ